MNVRPALLALGALALAFVFYSAAVAAGTTTSTDHAVAALMSHVWLPQVAALAQWVAFLGGVDLTIAITVGLGVYLYRLGFRQELWALAALPLSVVVELVYKLLMQHPQPFGNGHQDAPSLTMLLGRGIAIHNSYPSGHAARAVLVYGLLAFVILRLARPALWRRLAIPAAAVIIGLVALDRLYLGVHWTSDVIGGLLLGALALTAAVVWLDQPRRIS
jgi:undecaprenyl-diphosphatase